jgi:FtsP/CotA-like multicopper oxidase with cupredoxin domain
VSNKQRFAVAAAAVALAVVAFVIASPGADDEGADRDSGRNAATAQTETGATAGGETGATTQPRRVDRIRLRGGGVVGGARKIKVENGDIVRILVTSDAPDEIHLHGYDLIRDVRPGKRARFAFKADIEGEFELEAHDLGDLKIASVVVEPG